MNTFVKSERKLSVSVTSLLVLGATVMVDVTAMEVKEVISEVVEVVEVVMEVEETVMAMIADMAVEEEMIDTVVRDMEVIDMVAAEMTAVTTTIPTAPAVVMGMVVFPLRNTEAITIQVVDLVVGAALTMIPEKMSRLGVERTAVAAAVVILMNQHQRRNLLWQRN
jgi:hypothetical protein